jgi:hypothetical protein
MLYAPALGNYTYRLFDVSFDVDLYPARFTVDEAIAQEMGVDPQQPIVARDEDEFEKILSQILASQKTRKVIQAIYSQSSDLSPANGNGSG